VLSHLPVAAESAPEGERAGERGGGAEFETEETEAADFMQLESRETGAGVIALHSELRNLVVSLGVQVGLSTLNPKP